MIFDYDILSGAPCITLLNHPMSIYKQVWLPKGDYPFIRYREGRAEQLDTTGYEAWKLTYEEAFTHNKHIRYLIIIPGFKPIVSEEFPRGTLDSLMWKEHMEIEYFDQWGILMGRRLEKIPRFSGRSTFWRSTIRLTNMEISHASSPLKWKNNSSLLLPAFRGVWSYTKTFPYYK
jgi:hypothetical protein